MGVNVSTQSTLAPVSLASTIIGFISFSFTLATFTRVFWDNIVTFMAAESQIHDYLGNLKQGLYEERSHLRRIRKRWRRRSHQRDRSRSGREKWPTDDEKELHEDDVGIRVMSDSIKHMTQRARDMERPFLLNGSAEEQRNSWPDESPNAWYSTDYRGCGIRERWIWLRTKSDVVSLLEGLARLQTRRIAKEVGEMYFTIESMNRGSGEMDDKLYNIEHRLSRVVGIRRVT